MRETDSYIDTKTDIGRKEEWTTSWTYGVEGELFGYEKKSERKRDIEKERERERQTDM